MQLGMIGLGRMGGSMVQRLMRDGHDCVVYDRDAKSIQPFVAEGATGKTNLVDFVSSMRPPRAIWLMIPAGAVDGVLTALEGLVDAGDILIDGGNSYYKDDIVRADHLQKKAIHYLDVGTSGGVWGLERGYCLMIGGEKNIVDGLRPIFASLAPGVGDIPRTRGKEGEPGPAEQGYLHCGTAGAGHFVKMVHNGIEYALMAAYAEGFNLLKHAGIGAKVREVDAETSPLHNAEAFQYDINIADVAELWRRGSVVTSWLLDLTADALQESPDLKEFAGRVSDSGEGRWTSIAAIETGTPTPLLTTALYERFTSRRESEFANKVLSAMRFGFGGHHEKKS